MTEEDFQKAIAEIRAADAAGQHDRAEALEWYLQATMRAERG